MSIYTQYTTIRPLYLTQPLIGSVGQAVTQTMRAQLVYFLRPVRRLNLQQKQDPSRYIIGNLFRINRGDDETWVITVCRIRFDKEKLWGIALFNMHYCTYQEIVKL